MSELILKSTVSAAVTAATAAVKPLLLAAETANPGSAELAALHAELSNQLTIADNLLDTGGVHADDGGTDKGDGH